MSKWLFWVSTGFLGVSMIILVIPYSQKIVPVAEDQDNVDKITQTNTTGNRTKPTLQLVIVVTRHGARGPLASFPTSQYRTKDMSLWPYGPVELTQKGRVQMYNLGEKIRFLYNGFMNQTYRPQEFHCSSTLTTRTLQSAELFLAGLFPPTGYQVWNKDLLWQPVPVFPNFLDHSEMAVSESNVCPRFTKAQTLSLLEFDKLNNASLTAFADYILPHTGVDDNYLLKVFRVSNRALLVYFVLDYLKCLTYIGLPLPNWADKIYPEPLFTLWEKSAKALTAGSVDQIRYLEGELFQELVGLMQSKANNTRSPDRRMYYYSGHDCTLFVLQTMLNQEWDVYINPGSALIYELHRNPSTGQLTVQVLYIDGDSPDLDPQDIDIADCESPCDFHKMLKITEKYYNVTNWEEECHWGRTRS